MNELRTTNGYSGGHGALGAVELTTGEKHEFDERCQRVLMLIGRQTERA